MKSKLLSITLLLLVLLAKATNIIVGPNEQHTNIQSAIGSANSGDTILVQNGTYSGFNANKQNLTIKAIHRHKVIITGSGGLISGSANTTIIGLIVDGGGYVSGQGSQYQGMINAVDGWSILDCVVKGANGGREGLRTANGVNSANNVLVERTVFQDNGGNAMWGHGEKNIDKHNDMVIRDVIMRRNNQSEIDPGWYNSGTKLLYTNDITIDGLISYDNYGNGFWFDFGNLRYTVENSTFFGNHGSNSSFSNSGLAIEANAGPGVIRNNTFYSNVMDGIKIAESQNLTITGNTFAGNTKAWTFRSCCTSQRDPVANVTIEDNFIFNDDMPTDNGATIQNNTTLSSFMGPLVTVTNNSSAAPQITTGPEQNNLDSALIGALEGGSVSIPVYGRKSIVDMGNYWTTVVYDLSGRYIDLQILDQTSKDLVESSIPPYASIEARYLNVQIDYLSEYDIDASIGQEVINSLSLPITDVHALYPNPTSRELNYPPHLQNVRLVNSYGSTVARGNKGHITLDRVSSGIYTFIASDNDGTVIRDHIFVTGK